MKESINGHEYNSIIYKYKSLVPGYSTLPPFRVHDRSHGNAGSWGIYNGMKIGILTPDSKRPNLAAMKISAYHKSQGHEVRLNSFYGDFTYASVLFNWTPDPVKADLIGGPKYPHIKLDPEIEKMKPDYSLYPDMDYSLGYTYKACPRTCDFCIVPKQNNEETHYSIWDFHKSEFKRICLMNNNTLADFRWRDTFDEIIDANTVIVDDNGYDARLITEEAAEYMGRLKFDKMIHVAWDFPEHEIEVLTGLCNLIKHVKPYRIMCYVLIGNTTHEEDMGRVSALFAMGIMPFIMPLNKRDFYQKRFARWVNHKAIFKTVSWKDYK